MSDYLRRLREARQQGYEEGLAKGIHVGANLTTISVNRACGLGRKSFKKAEGVFNELIGEIVRVNDPEWTEVQIQKALDQIK